MFIDIPECAPRTFFKNLKRKDYIEKASQIIRSEGTQAVSIRRMAKELDCSTTAMYRHFQNLDELLFYAHLSDLNTYIANLEEKVPTWNSMWDVHFGIWELYSDQAFRKPEAFELIFYRNLNKDLGSALEEYYEMFPETIVNVTPLIKEMLQIPGYYERDYHILMHLVEHGLITPENTKKINHIECNLFLGYFKYVQDTGISEEDVPNLVAQFMAEVKEIISLYQLSDMQSAANGLL